jgi:hypothetical protein
MAGDREVHHAKVAPNHNTIGGGVECTVLYSTVREIGGPPADLNIGGSPRGGSRTVERFLTLTLPRQLLQCKQAHARNRHVK